MIYDRLATMATGLIERYGADVTIERNTDTVDPVTGVVTPGLNQDYTVTGVLLPYPDKLIDGTRIKTGDRMLLIDGQTEPLMTDRPTVNGKTWAVVNIDTLNPAGTPLIYKIQVRG